MPCIESSVGRVLAGIDRWLRCKWEQPRGYNVVLGIACGLGTTRARTARARLAASRPFYLFTHMHPLPRDTHSLTARYNTTTTQHSFHRAQRNGVGGRHGGGCARANGGGGAAALRHRDPGGPPAQPALAQPPRGGAGWGRGGRGGRRPRQGTDGVVAHWSVFGSQRSTTTTGCPPPTPS